jgi:hypothetical protein
MERENCLEIHKVSPLKFLAFSSTIDDWRKEKGMVREIHKINSAKKLYPDDREVRFSLVWRHYLIYEGTPSKAIIDMCNHYNIDASKIYRVNDGDFEIGEPLLAAAAVARLDDSKQFILESLGVIAAAFSTDFEGALKEYGKMN